ncbi:hypothetical protein [Cellulomonas carbonis]|uniref:Uncharacterized protein n=1 Tax=Cellulomonas carbonis T26 TaxID=947969 RepID=A0A0A0BVN9_9CELL|nr:hypothetical protein [Cellulomonas carbonis]KGM12468.1 hypothetical protein N868_11810 [Cellulomonas carbonis T26]GGC15553.1 hypothetical protein GCM10010972_31020 [Cellulomonas carbonis]
MSAAVADVVVHAVVGDVGRGPGSWVASTAAAPDDPGMRQFEPTDVTPGVLGFAVTFAVVIGLVVLLLSMVGKLRRVNHRPPDEVGGPDVAGEPDRPGEAGPPHHPPTDPGAAPTGDGRA